MQSAKRQEKVNRRAAEDAEVCAEERFGLNSKRAKAEFHFCIRKNEMPYRYREKALPLPLPKSGDDLAGTAGEVIPAFGQGQGQGQ